MLLAGDLEPAVLGAVLEGPWAGSRHWINLSQFDLTRVIVPRVHIGDIFTEIHHKRDDSIARGFLILFEKVTHLCPVAVLDRLQENISVEEHPVVGAHALAVSASERLGDDVVLITGITLFALASDVLHSVLNHLGAELATLEGRSVSLFIKLPEVNDGLHDSRGGPRADSEVRIALTEPG